MYDRTFTRKELTAAKVARRCYVKKVFLRIPQILQENTPACNFIKKETLVHVVSCELRTPFLRTPFLNKTSGG